MTAPENNDLKLLRDYFSEPQIQLDDKIIKKFSVAGVTPKLVIFPKSYEEIRTAVKLARKLKKKILAAGNNHCHYLAAKPDNFDWAISTSQMNQVLSHDAADFSVTVQAGVSLSHIQKQLAPKKQFLPLDPFGGAEQTIGGIAATNSAGSYRYHFGTCQDLILGMKIILPDGRLIKTGGKTVKNVAGYNLSRLFTGSMGTLGIIAEITLKLSPIAPFQRTALIGFETDKSSAQAAQFIRSSNMVFDRLDFLNANFLQSLQTDGSEINSESKYFLLVSGSGTKKAVEHSIERLEKEISGWNTFLILPDDKNGSNIWQQLSESGFAQIEQKNDVWLQIIAPKAGIWNLMNEIEKTFPGSFMHGLAGNGVLDIFFRKEKIGQSDELKKAIEKLRASCANQQGFVIARKLPDDLRDAHLVWGRSNEIMPLMNSIKRKLDPDGIMVSGRYFGGI